MIEVVGLGQCCIDYLALSHEFPAEDVKLEFEKLVVQGGGPAATALVCLSRLGRRTALIGRVGDDQFGRFIRQGLLDEGVDTTFLETVAGSSSQFAFILVNAARATRTVFWKRAGSEEVRPDSLPDSLIQEARVTHLDGLMIDASIEAARLAKQAGRTVVLDSGTLRPRSLEVVRQVDHAVVSESFILAYAPGADLEDALKRLFDLGLEAVVVTKGPNGAIGFDGGQVVHQPAFKVRAVDTTGAGDAFHGAYIHGLLEGWSLTRRLRFAASVAAMSCTEVGGRTALPDLKSVEKFLETH